MVSVLEEYKISATVLNCAAIVDRVDKEEAVVSLKALTRALPRM